MLVAMSRDLLRTQYWTIVADDDARVVTRERTAERFATIDTVEAEYEAASRALDRIHRADYGVLVDLRAAPGRNDDAYEAVAQRHNARLYGGFRRVAVLVQTHAGKLQVRRFLDHSRADAEVFTDEAEARAFARG